MTQQSSMRRVYLPRWTGQDTQGRTPEDLECKVGHTIGFDSYKRSYCHRPRVIYVRLTDRRSIGPL